MFVNCREDVEDVQYGRDVDEERVFGEMPTRADPASQ